MERIIIASNNEGKIKEIREIFSDMQFQFLSLGDIGFTQDIVEDKDSFEGNALKKAFTVMEAAKELTLADDSGLEVDILDGRPGVLSARFSGEKTTDKENNDKLLRLMAGVPIEKRGAQFRCVVAIVTPSGESLTAQGICPGKIGDRPYGSNGFGYDPIFIPYGYDKTFAQLEDQEKNRISHRFKALCNLREAIRKNNFLGTL